MTFTHLVFLLLDKSRKPTKRWVLCNCNIQKAGMCFCFKRPNFDSLLLTSSKNRCSFGFKAIIIVCCDGVCFVTTGASTTIGGSIVATDGGNTAGEGEMV